MHHKGSSFFIRMPDHWESLLSVHQNEPRRAERPVEMLSFPSHCLQTLDSHINQVQETLR